MQRAAVEAMSTLDREKSMLLGIGYALSVVTALGALLVGSRISSIAQLLEA
jgi:hypothetical protein